MDVKTLRTDSSWQALRQVLLLQKQWLTQKGLFSGRENLTCIFLKEIIQDRLLYDLSNSLNVNFHGFLFIGDRVPPHLPPTERDGLDRRLRSSPRHPGLDRGARSADHCRKAVPPPQSLLGRGSTWHPRRHGGRPRGSCWRGGWPPAWSSFVRFNGAGSSDQSAGEVEPGRAQPGGEVRAKSAQRLRVQSGDQGTPRSQVQQEVLWATESAPGKPYHFAFKVVYTGYSSPSQR